MKEKTKKKLRVPLTLLLKIIEAPIIAALILLAMLGFVYLLDKSQLFTNILFGFAIIALLCIIGYIMWNKNYKLAGKLLKIKEEPIIPTIEEKIE